MDHVDEDVNECPSAMDGNNGPWKELQDESGWSGSLKY
jgi:hypothetical protein